MNGNPNPKQLTLTETALTACNVKPIDYKQGSNTRHGHLILRLQNIFFICHVILVHWYVALEPCDVVKGEEVSATGERLKP